MMQYNIGVEWLLVREMGLGLGIGIWFGLGTNHRVWNWLHCVSIELQISTQN